MKNRTFYFLVLLIAAITVSYSCEKDDKNDTFDLLVNNVWVYDTLTISDMEDDGLVLAAAFLHLGFSGGEFDYNSDNTYTAKSDIKEDGGTWELIGNKIFMDKGTEDEFEMEILVLNNNIAEFKVPMAGEIFTIPYSGFIILKFHKK